MPRVTISILCLDNLKLTQQCVESILRNTDDINLIVTNNGSRDGTAAYIDRLANQLPFVLAIHHENNLGFQLGHERAFEFCDTEFFMLLNNDTVIGGPEWLPELLRPMKDPGVAASGPVGNCCSIRQESFFGHPGGQFEYLEGSCLLLRTQVIREIGLFSKYISHSYGEDSDLSLRIRYAGYRLSRARVPVRHIGSATSRHMPEVKQHLKKNCAVLMRVWRHYLMVRKVNHPVLIRRTAAIGDVLLTTPLIRAISEQRRTCQIFVETAFPELLAGNPDVDGAYRSSNPSPDTQVIDLNMSYENSVGVSILDAYQDAASIEVKDRRLWFYPSEDAVRKAGEIFDGLSGFPACIIAPGPTTWAGKNWGEDRFGEVSIRLQSRGWKVVLVGTSLHPTQIAHSVDLRGKTNFDLLGAVMGMAQLFIGLDSFPLHMAMSQRLPAVGIFGATLPQFILSDGVAIGVHADQSDVPCVGARHRVAGATHVQCDGACMRAVTVDMVMNAVNRMIGIACNEN